MGDLSRTQELELREEQGDAGSALEPRRRLNVQHPYNGPEDESNLAPTLDLFMFFRAGCLWADSAQGFGQIRGGSIANSTTQYGHLLSLCFLLAYFTGDGVDTDSDDPLLPNAQRREKLILTWVVVKSNDPDNNAGFLVRLSYNIQADVALRQIETFLSECDKQERVATSAGRTDFFKSNGRPSHRRLTHNAYVDMCDYYLSRSSPYRSEGFNGIDSQGNPYCPKNIFTLQNALMKMQNAGARPDFLDRRCWSTANETISFPNRGLETYKCSPSEFNPMMMQKTYLPHAAQENISLDSEEFIAFARNAGVDPRAGDQDTDAMDEDSEAAAGGAGARPTVATLMNAFKRLASCTDSDSSNTLATYKKWVLKRMALARSIANGDLQKYAFERRIAQKDCLRHFEKTLFTTDDTSDCGDSLKAIAKWYRAQLQADPTNQTFMYRSDKYSSNLSRFGDLQAQESIACETAWSVLFSHQEIKSVRTSSLHVYFYSPFHTHVNLLGPPGGGKSNVFTINITRLIPGTTRDLGAESAKAKMTPGRKTDLAIETFEDIPPGQVGVSSFSGGGKAAMTSNTDAESLLKYRLTKGRVKGTYKQVINGVHAMVEIESFCNTVMLVGMNALLSQVPESIASRFNNIQFVPRVRTDGVSKSGNSMMNKFALAADPKLDPMRNTIKIRDFRNQCMHALIQLQCFAGVFVKPCMDVPILIWSQALILAKERGMHDTENVRHFERAKMHCETHVVEDAIDRIFDSELSPFDPDALWKIENLIEAEKHLTGYSEHASMAFGLLQHQWENSVIMAVEKFFISHLFKKKIKNNEFGASAKQRNDPRFADHIAMMEYYYITRTDNMANGGMMDRDRNMQQHDHLNRLAKHICRHSSTNKFSEEEVQYALSCLASIHLDVPLLEKPTETVRVPALQFSHDGEVMVARHLLNNFEQKKLIACLKEVLCHKFTTKKNILYGQTKASIPYVWKTLAIGPSTTRQLVMDQPSNFSETLINITRNAVKGIVRAMRGRAGPDTMQESDLDPETFSSMFSDSCSKDVDVDLDEFASLKLATDIGLHFFPPTPDAPNYNTSPLSFTEGVFDWMKEHSPDRLEALESYPACVPEMQPIKNKQQVEKDRLEHPEKFSLAAKMEQMRRQTWAAKRRRDEYEGGAAAAGEGVDDMPPVRVLQPRFTEAFAEDESEVEEDEDEEEDPALAIQQVAGNGDYSAYGVPALDGAEWDDLAQQVDRVRPVGMVQ